jgi:hypothetical protein
MTIEYIVLGAILILMGLIQTWLRHGPEGRKLKVEQDKLVQRRLENAGPRDESDAAERAAKRSRKLWTGWTAVLGGVGIAFGIVLIVLGILGD